MRTTGGELTVDRDALHHHTSPREFLAGQTTRFRKGTTRQRLRAVGAVVTLLALPVLLVARLQNAASGTAGLALLVSTFYVGTMAVRFWGQYVRDWRIPRSDVETLSLDPDERELTIRYTRDESRLPSLTSKPYTKTLDLPSDDEVRDLRRLLRSVGLDAADADDADASEPDPVPCANCGTRVSPDAGWCPSCSSVLGVARATRDVSNGPLRRRRP